MGRFTVIALLLFVLSLAYVCTSSIPASVVYSTIGHAYSIRPSSPFKLSSSSGKRSKSLFMSDLFFEEYQHFRVRDAHQQLSHHSDFLDPHNQLSLHYHFSQVHNGLPVIGSYVKVHTKEEEIEFINGVFVPDITTNTIPGITEGSAQQVALVSVYNKYKERLVGTRPREGLTIESSSLSLFHTGLPRGVSGDVKLVFDIVITHEERKNLVRERVFVDANTAQVVNQFSTINNAMNRHLWYYTSNHSTPYSDPFLQGELVWREDQGISAISDPNIALILKNAELTYKVFKNILGWDSYDNRGAVMHTIYNFTSAYMCPNAAWLGDTIILCPSFDLADVIIHEWTHAYTTYIDGLFYQYESGALNEAISDIVAEAVQILVALPENYPIRTDDTCYNSEDSSTSKRWIVGDQIEKLVAEYPDWAPYRNGRRDAYNPNCVEYLPGQGSPRSTYDPFYITNNEDNGGVHGNSGVINQGFAFLVDGGSFNGTTVIGIGAIKALHIYLRAKGVYQGPLTTFAQHADALVASCSDLIGLPLVDPISGAISAETISTSDCDQIENVITLTGLRYKPEYNSFETPEIVGAIPKYQPVYEHEADIFEWPLVTLLANEFDYYAIWTAVGRFEGSVTPGILYGECAAPNNYSIQCRVPSNYTSPQTLSISVKVGEIEDDSEWSDPVTVFLVEKPIISGLQLIEQGDAVLVTGSGFQSHQDCSVAEESIDAENTFDCLVCRFGDVYFGPVVAATLISSTALSCPTPPLEREGFETPKVFVGTTGLAGIQYAGRVALCGSNLILTVQIREGVSWYENRVLHRIVDLSLNNLGTTTVSELVVQFTTTATIEENTWNLHKIQNNIYSFELYGHFTPGRSFHQSSGFILEGEGDLTGHIYDVSCVV